MDLDHLTTPITKQEVVTAMQSCSKHSTPGLDGLPCEFYHTFLNVVPEDLVEVYNHCLFEDECLTNTMRKAVITLIPKKGDTGDLNNWRLISLRNCDFKILAKSIANRLKPNLEALNAQTQAWPPNTRPYHTILPYTVREIIMYANYKRIPTFIVSMDKEKAFDKVSLKFMF
jgi:Reverse transcriptase (RNA-dependent DNA polymerase).